MRFVIVGPGSVGMRTARVLRQEGHEVVLVDPNRSRVDRLQQEGFEVVEGDGSDEELLKSLDLESADGLAALTGDLAVNVVACMIAKAHGCRTVLRAESDYREYVVSKYSQDVDEVIYPERLGAVVTKNALLGGSIHAIADISPDVQLLELTVTEQSPMRGYTLTELELPADARVLGFGKADGKTGLPEPDQSLELGDRVIVIADYDVLEDVRQIIVGQGAPIAATSAAGSGGA
jgi:trk system potassium uptake protein TrkA